jgi:uncharacterized protein (DUF952 family)
VTSGATSRWLYHVVLRDEWERLAAAKAYDPRPLTGEAFLHASYRDAVLESARLYFPEGSARVVLRIDPRRLGARVVEVATPRGPMPHVYGAVEREAIAEVYEEAKLAASIGQAPDHLA